MNPAFLAASLGMPTAPAPKPKTKGNPAHALSAALAAHKAGDHHTAKKHALKAVNLLHAMAGPAVPPAPPAV